MKKTVAPRFVDDTNVLVTKEFAKNARIFGTPEYELWKRIRMDCAKATMVTKTIRKNPNKKTSTKNMTYENMALYIRQQENAETLLAEFEKQIATSKVQTNPYRHVLAWFCENFAHYDSYKDFFEQRTRADAEEKSLFRVVKNENVSELTVPKASGE